MYALIFVRKQLRVRGYGHLDGVIETCGPGLRAGTTIGVSLIVAFRAVGDIIMAGTWAVARLARRR
ncbi:hypothetical protein [Streptomyces sirii]|uniref:hypothetical protein n=1 Tax=Streptomyces sirii TaxID=3127701 RepID=UPI003D35E0F4